MPLQMGDVSVTRPQRIVYDPKSLDERKDAIKRAAELKRLGYKLGDLGLGWVQFLPPERNPNHGMFRILSQNGDDHIVWDRTDPKQVKEAFKKFKDLAAKGYTMFSTLTSGKKGHKIDVFDPSLQEIISTAKEIIAVPKTMPG